MDEMQKVAIWQRLKDKDVRWLRNNFFSPLGSSVAVNKLLDTSNREQYLKEIFDPLSDDSLLSINKALTESAIRKQISFFSFATDIDATGSQIKAALLAKNRDVIREVDSLIMGFADFCATVNLVEKEESAVVYLSELVADHAENIIMKLSYLVGRGGKERTIIFNKNCNLSEAVKNFIHDTGAICDRVSTLGL